MCLKKEPKDQYLKGAGRMKTHGRWGLFCTRPEKKCLKLGDKLIWSALHFAYYSKVTSISRILIKASEGEK